MECKSTNVHRKRWHRPERLRKLRNDRKLNQSAFADALNQYMQEQMPDLYHPSMALTQSMVSDLELGRTNVSLPLLYAIAGFFDVAPEDLLVPVLNSYAKDDAIISAAQIRDSDEKLTISASFPSPLFIDDSFLKSKINSKQYYTEVYTLTGFITFLFSPAGSFSRKEKAAILARMIRFFSSSLIYRSFYFSRKNNLAKWHHYTPAIFMSGADIMCPLPQEYEPDSHEKTKFVRLKNKEVSSALESRYLDSMNLIKESMIFLRIALEIMEAKMPKTPLRDIEQFYRECNKRSFDLEAIKEAFNPDMQGHLEALAL